MSVLLRILRDFGNLAHPAAPREIPGYAFPTDLANHSDVAGKRDGSVIDLRPVTYILKDDPLNTVRLGIVADEANDVEAMLVVHEDGEIESFKYELLAVGLLKEVQRLSARVATLEAAA